MGFIDFEMIIITPEMMALIAEIDEFSRSWQSLEKIDSKRLLALKRSAKIESIGSSTRIEGSKLSNREVETLLDRFESKSFVTRDEQEVAGYTYVCDEIYSRFDEIPFSEGAIKQIHMWLLRYSERDEAHRGGYKKVPIKIEAFDLQHKSLGVLLETTSPMLTPIQMHDLVNWTNESSEQRDLHSLIVIGLFTVVFLAIHPFQDGNGRISRLLTSLLMLKAGYHHVSYSSLESIIEANKDSYYIALLRTQKAWQSGMPDWSPWLNFFLSCLQKQKQHLEVKFS